MFFFCQSMVLGNRLPGRHLARPPGLFVRLVCKIPGRVHYENIREPSRPEVKEIHCASLRQNAGSESLPVWVNGEMRLPRSENRVRKILRLAPSMRTYAIRSPSGDQAGSATSPCLPSTSLRIELDRRGEAIRRGAKIHDIMAGG